MCIRDRIDNIVELDQVLGQGELMIKHEPHPLFSVVLLRPIYRLSPSISVYIDWSVTPNLRRRLLWVKVRMNRVVIAFLEENFTYEELTRWNLDEALLNGELVIGSQVSLLLGFGCRPQLSMSIIIL